MSPWKIALTIILCVLVATPAVAPHLAVADLGNWSHHLDVAAAVAATVPKLDHRLLLSGADLDALGIKFHRVHRMRLIKAGKFPAPIKLGQLSGSHNFWIAEEIFAWIASRAAARDELSDPMTQK